MTALNLSSSTASIWPKLCRQRVKQLKIQIQTISDDDGDDSNDHNDDDEEIVCEVPDYE